MKIILANGIELNPIVVTGASSMVQGVKRDTLSFVFPAAEDMGGLDAAFSEAACETITIISSDGSQSIYKGYVIRAELKKASVVVSSATEENEAIVEDRITVSMAQRTYTETHLASLTDTIDVLVMESLM